MAKPYDFSTALMVPQQGPKAKARADQAAIEKRRRELIDEKQTMDARKEDQVLANIRRQSYSNIGQMQFAPQNPIQYKNTVPAVELSQAPLQPGTETAVGGPEDKGSYATDLLRQLESAKGQPAPDSPTIAQPTQAPTGDGYAAGLLKQMGSTPAAAPRNPAIDDTTMQAFAAQYDYSKPGLASRMREYPKKDNPAWFITDDDPNKAEILVYRPVPGKTGNSFDDNFVAVPLSSMRDGKFYVDGQPTSPVKKGAPKPNAAQAWAASNVNSFTFGNADMLKGGIAAVTGGNYDDTVAQTRDFMKRAREAEPGASAVGDATGFLGPGAVIAKPVGMIAKPFVQAAQRAGPALGFAAKTAEAGLQGLAGGAAYGYTAGAENKAIDEGRASPDLFAPERTDAAVESGTMGAGFGAAMPALGVALRPIANAAGGLGARLIEPFMPGATAAHNANIATQAVRRSLERAGILTVDDFVKRAARYQGKPAMVGEVAGQDALNSLVALTRMKGTTSEKASAILEDRVQGMPGRMLRDLADETGLNPEQVLASVDEMVKAGRARAAPAYDKAEQAPFAETANLERIVRDAPILQGLMRKAENRVQNQAVAQIGQADQMPPLKVYDELKQLVDEEINKRIANGIGISDIQGVRDSLVRELDTISAQAATGSEAAPLTASLYAQAREVGGDAPRVQEGLKKGERALSGSKNVEDVVREVQAINGEQLTAYQIGTLRNLVRDVENGRLSPKRISSPAFSKKLREVLGDKAATGIIRKFSVEADLLKKGNRIDPNQNSVTGTVLNAPVSKMGDMAVNAASQLARGNVVGATIDAAKEGINSLRRLGFSENQLNAIGDILTNQNMDEAAGRLFPRGPGGAPPVIPPPVPPAGKLRENAPPTPPTRTIPPKAPVAGGPVAIKDRAVWEMRGAGLSNAEIARRVDTTESMVDVHYRKAERALGAPPSDPSVLSKYPEKAPTQAAATVSTAEPFTSKAGNATLNYEERPFWWADDSLDVSMDYVPEKPPTLSETKDLFTQMYDRMKAKMQAEGRSVYSANGDTPSKRKLYDSAVKALPPPDGYTPMKSPGSNMILFVRNDMVGKLPEGAPKDLAPISSVTPLKPAPKPPTRGAPPNTGLGSSPPRKVSKPQSLLTWIKSQGGIDDSRYMTGDIKQIMGSANARPGLLNRQSGKGLDDLVAAAYEQGFDVNPDDANSLMRLIAEEFGGNPSYRIGAKEEYEIYLEELMSKGTPPKDKN